MTLAINEVKKHNVSHKVHEYSHDDASASYGLEAAEKLGVSADRVCKPLASFPSRPY
ncbi:MAG: Cys-tRNA(Pro)/Cys-tRNA(Cys) deacylase [Candidatus Endobugula sp.]|jgi:Cys-tRNA(Pro)/Cys-tRNA(Cys) deacylase